MIIKSKINCKVTTKIHILYLLSGLGERILIFLVQSSELIYSNNSLMAVSMDLCTAFACFSPRWPKQQPALLRRGFPTASSAQADRASPAQRRERERNGRRRTERKTSLLNSWAAHCTAACPSPSTAQKHTDACLLPPCRSHMSTVSSSSPTWVLSLYNWRLLRRSVARLEDSTVAQEASSVSPPLGVPSSVRPSLQCLPHPNNNTQTGPSKHDLQLHYQRPKAPRDTTYAREREKKNEPVVGEEWMPEKKKVENGGKVSKDKKSASTKTSENAKKDSSSYSRVHFDPRVGDPAK